MQSFQEVVEAEGYLIDFDVVAETHCLTTRALVERLFCGGHPLAEPSWRPFVWTAPPASIRRKIRRIVTKP